MCLGQLYKYEVALSLKLQIKNKQSVKKYSVFKKDTSVGWVIFFYPCRKPWWCKACTKDDKHSKGSLYLGFIFLIQI